MKYSIDYQYSEKGSRPYDDGRIIGIEATDESGVVLLPNVGDYVHANYIVAEEKSEEFYGKVRSRLFNYHRNKENEIFCSVNIVVEKTDDDLGMLIKE